jgi:hypothetical protein
VSEAADARKARRRQTWIALFALPGHLALLAFALIALLQEMRIEPSDAWEIVIVPVMLIGVACWGFGPFLIVIGVVLWLRDPWRASRPRAERIRLKVLVWGSPVAWLLTNLISDRYHLLR